MKTLHPGATELYSDAAFYDRLYVNRDEDRKWYRSLAADCQTIVELGAGTGRITAELASGGAAVQALSLIHI